jgi:hypothetical protein
MPFDRLRANEAGFPILVSLWNLNLRAIGRGGLTGKAGYLGPIAAHHGFLLPATPAFDLLF